MNVLTNGQHRRTKKVIALMKRMSVVVRQANARTDGTSSELHAPCCPRKGAVCRLPDGTANFA
jgi:hypothetical protein